MSTRRKTGGAVRHAGQHLWAATGCDRMRPNTHCMHGTTQVCTRRPELCRAAAIEHAARCLSSLHRLAVRRPACSRARAEGHHAKLPCRYCLSVTGPSSISQMLQIQRNITSRQPASLARSASKSRRALWPAALVHCLRSGLSRRSRHSRTASLGGAAPPERSSS